MTIVYDKLLALKFPTSSRPTDRRMHALRARRRARARSARTTTSSPFVYEKNLKVLPTMAVVLGYPGFWAQRSRHRHRLGEAGGRRVGARAAPPARARAAPWSAGRASPRSSTRAPARARWSIPSARSSTRRPASGSRPSMQTTFCRGDGGFGGPPREQRAGASDPRARARSRLRSADAARDGADLPAERRSQSAACRSRGRQGGGLPAPDPAWALRPSASPATPFSRRCAATIRRGSRRSPAASRRRCSRARPSAPRCGATDRW